MPTISSGDNCIHPVAPDESTASAIASCGVDRTAAAVSPPQPMAASSTNARATVRRVTFTIWLRSINGTRISTNTARPGSTTEPTTSSGPLNSFSVWNKNRKYHSGRGTQSLGHRRDWHVHGFAGRLRHGRRQGTEKHDLEEFEGCPRLHQLAGSEQRAAARKCAAGPAQTPPGLVGLVKRHRHRRNFDEWRGVLLCGRPVGPQLNPECQWRENEPSTRCTTEG